MSIRLCFGTFINVLACCTKETVNKTQLTGTIIQTIDPESKYIDSGDLRRNSTLYSELSHLYLCKSDFSPSYSKIKELASKTQRRTIVKQLESTVIPLMDEDKYAQIILTICDIIKKDDTLSRKDGGINIEKFQKHIRKDIEDLLNDTEYILSEFLTDIFCYTVIEIKNTSGRESLNEISETEKEEGKKIGKKRNYNNFFEEYVNNFRDKRNTILVWETKGQMKRHLHHNSENARNNQSSDKIQPTPMLDEFYHSFENYGIEAFIDINPINPFPSFYIQDADNFVGHINTKHKSNDSPDKNEDIYNSIIKFTYTLDKYILFLIEHSINESAFDYGNYPLKYEALSGNDNEFEKKISHYRKQLKTLYQEIFMEVEKEKELCLQIRRTEFREMLYQDTHRRTLHDWKLM